MVVFMNKKRLFIYSIIFFFFNFIIINQMYAKRIDHVYRLYLFKDISTLDPIKINDSQSYEVAYQIYNGLVTYRTKINKNGENLWDIIPDLAESWDISFDKKIYTFKLKKNIRFHSGKLLDTWDIKYSFERLLDPRNKSPIWLTSFILPIKGLKKFQQDCITGIQNPDLSGLKIIDNNIISIILDQEFPYTLNVLALPYYYIVPNEEFTKCCGNYIEHAVGTGIYMLENYKKKQLITLKLNPYYIGEKPYIKEINYLILSDKNKIFKEFTLENFEQSHIPENIFYEIINNKKINSIGTDLLEKDSFNNPEYSNIIKSPVWKTSYISMNINIPPFNNIKTRHAFNYAINKENLITNVLKHHGIVINGVLPKYFPGNNNNNNNNTPYPYNPIIASKLLFEANWKDKDIDGYLEPPKGKNNLVLWYNPSKIYDKLICEEIKKDLENIKVKIIIKPIKKTTPDSEINFFINTIEPLYILPMPKQFFLFYSRLGLNSNFFDPQVDRLLKKSNFIKDWIRRKEIYNQIENIIIQQAPSIFLFQFVTYKIFQPYVRNQQIHPILPNVIKNIYYN